MVNCCWLEIRGGFRGGRGGGLRTPSPQGFDPLPTQRAPLCTILRYSNLVTDPKNFLKVPLAPIYTYFERERAPKKRNFFVKIF